MRGEGSHPSSLNQRGILRVSQGSGWIPLEKLGERKERRKKPSVEDLLPTSCWLLL